MFPFFSKFGTGLPLGGTQSGSSNNASSFRGGVPIVAELLDSSVDFHASAISDRSMNGRMSTTQLCSGKSQRMSLRFASAWGGGVGVPAVGHRPVQGVTIG